MTVDEGGSALAYSDTLTGMLEARLKQRYPRKHFWIVNLAIGGQTWATFNSTPSLSSDTLYPNWYTDPYRHWLYYIHRARCNVLFIGLGINDGAGFKAPIAISALRKISRWSRAPDVVLITNNVPNNVSPYDVSYFQDGCYATAAIERKLAKRKALNVQVIDAGRRASIVIDGYDPVTGVYTDPIITADVVT